MRVLNRLLPAGEDDRVPRPTLIPALLLWIVAAMPAPLPAQAATIVVVRHAEKADTTGNSALTAAGIARAEALRVALAAFPLQGIFVSEYRRTALTAAPTAAAMGLTPVAVPIQGNKAAQATATAAAIRAMAPGSAALVVGHSNTVGPLIAALGGPEVSALCDGEHATLFLLELPADLPPRLLRASYGAPDAPVASACHTAEAGDSAGNTMH